MVFHVLFYNPVFIGLLLAAVLIPERLLDRWIKARLPRMETVSFISERRKVTLPVGELLYVESNDTEVFLHTADGGLYPTRTRISQWERLLDDRFIRIHRAWLVNAERVSRVTMTDVTIERVTLEVSRKYRNAVAERFGLHKPAR
jgi:DNA-binding LytR/AlgR family response regulator